MPVTSVKQDIVHSGLDFDSSRPPSPFMNESHHEWRRQLRKFIDKEIAPFVDEWDEAGEFPRELHQKASEFGLIGMGYPEEYGGIGLGCLDHCLVLEEVAYGCLGFNTSLAANMLGAMPIIIAGDEAQKKKYLGGLTDEYSFAAYACSEPDAGTDVSARIIRSLFDVARQYRESIDVYGSEQTVEWPLVEGEPLVVHTAKKPEAEIPSRVMCPDFSRMLPEPIRRFTTGGVYDMDETKHLSFTQGGGHGGSHPHLVHEFISALRSGRDPWPNARQSANWTCVGILAHESAMAGGKPMPLPAFTLSSQAKKA